MYDHSNSDHESGDSMSNSSDLGHEESNAKKKPRSSASATSENPRSCSYCGNEYLASQSKNVPFCSKRCQQVDLGMWLTESYGLPYEGEGSGAQFEDSADEDSE